MTQIMDIELLKTRLSNLVAKAGIFPNRRLFKRKLGTGLITVNDWDGFNAADEDIIAAFDWRDFDDLSRK